jgi:tetraprenyl-beta-curcumene synthase
LLREQVGDVLADHAARLDRIDNVSERHPTHLNGQRLHQVLVDALDPERPLRDYYRHHLARDDGGYLHRLAVTCRDGCRALPSYPRLRPHLLREAHRSRVLGLNHEPDPAARDAGLRRWAAEEYPEERALHWWELSGAASATLYSHALLALAASPDVDERQIAAVSAAHWPWIALATTNLDSYVDWTVDRATGGHSYLDHYPDLDQAIARTRDSITIALRRAQRAPRGDRQMVIVACMVALYLSAPAANAPELRATTATLVAAGGQLVQILVPILRLWRMVNRQRQ